MMTSTVLGAFKKTNTNSSEHVDQHNDTTGTSGSQPNGSSAHNGTTVPTTRKKEPQDQKYRHVAAAHSKSRTSFLSRDSDAAPSFLGFRNLMVIVLGMVTSTLSSERFIGS